MIHTEATIVDTCPLLKALQAAQRRCEELEEALNSRSQVVEMLQQEVSSADQQKQVDPRVFCISRLLSQLSEVRIRILPDEKENCSNKHALYLAGTSLFG